ncbi:multifunctional transcriptional regulator/nicotinamide-nucleotide adenylyltransferase/ribosylnicotinamide kinase NadR [Orbaceae bacterium ESL0727]|nr:multifunctional transcriptional regulator/nicotinamide-nucleotide adenylyltransferase/ribosylnicotinamide kinase NadR [Orbaceae bacterium ESL0727]
MALVHRIGLIFGKFYPLHCGHIYLIEKAMSQVDELHIMLGCEATRDKKLFIESHLPKQPQVSDRYLWLQKTFKNRHNIHIHVLDEAGIQSYPNGWQDWSDRVKTILREHNVQPTVVFTSEPQDVKNHALYFGCDVKMIDAARDFIPISATEIRRNPYKNWSFIAKQAQSFFVRKVAIIGTNKMKELPIQLANIYNTEYVANGYINYIEREILVKQNHRYLSEADYIRIAMIHADRIKRASDRANKLLFTSFDFTVLANYYRDIFKQDSEVLKELANNYHFDLVIHEEDLNPQNSELDNFDIVTKQIEGLLI